MIVTASEFAIGRRILAQTDPHTAANLHHANQNQLQIKGNRTTARTTAKGPRYAFLGVFVSPQVLPPRRLGTDSVTSGSCTRSFKQFSKNPGHLHEISNLYSARCSQQAQSKYQSAQLTARSDTVRAHCAHTLPARTVRAYCALTLRARTARAKLLPKSWILLTKPLILLTKRSILPPKFANGQGVRCVRASVRCERAVSSACIYGDANIVYWISRIISNTIRHVALSLVNPSTLEVLGKPYSLIGRRCMADTLT